MHERETGVSGSVGGTEGKSLAKIFQCCAGTTVSAEAHGIIAANVKLVRRNVARGAALDMSESALPQPQIELTRYRAGNIALKGEDVFQLAIVDFRPANGTVPRIHEPDLNPESRTGLLYPALEDVGHSQIASYPAHARAAVLEGECGGGSHDAKIRDSRQHRDQLLAEAVHESRVLLIAADVRKRSEEHTSELQSQSNLVCRLLLEKKKIQRAYSMRIPSLLH